MIGHERHARASGPVLPAQLDGAPMVAYPPICDRARMEQALARHGVRPHIVSRTAGNETALSMAPAAMGSAVLPQLTVHSADFGSDASLRVHALEPELPPREDLPAGAGTSHSLPARGTGDRDRGESRGRDRRGPLTRCRAPLTRSGASDLLGAWGRHDLPGRPYVRCPRPYRVVTAGAPP
ncbi:LysR family transcriptional regulator substrate-binding protein [Streptomyces sp. NPDC058295]|uniref:LysR family transcriptional regulator substrate-binding protein n=1 Tax=Streptomyces sp. NPDC058295 TaxID=3346431 RepID=UPI0036E2DD02